MYGGKGKKREKGKKGKGKGIRVGMELEELNGMRELS